MDGSPGNTIRVFDLILVIVRFRLIVVLTTVLGLIVGLYMFVALPLLPSESRVGSNYTAQRTFEVVASPALIAATLSADGSTLARGYFLHVGAVTNAFRGAHLDITALSSAELDKPGALENYVVTRVIGRDLTSQYDPDTRILLVQFTSNDPESSKKFLDLLTTSVVDRVASDFRQKYQNVGKDIDEELSQLGNKGIQGYDRAAVILGIQERRFQLAQLMGEPTFPLHSLGETVVSLGALKIASNSISGATGVLIATSVAFLVSLIFACILEYFRALAANPVDMEMLRRAIKRGSRKV